MSEFLNTDSDDVIRIPDRGALPSAEMVSVAQLWSRLRSHWSNPQDLPWFAEGKEGEMLKTSGGGWRKGRFRLRLEFIPDDSDNLP